ncbi:hypothetical protein [Porticoccus sp.]|uniref:hypothetical protein n=1 Tax=Porticoccus sp. TaxID=2024853 RepID=UPI003F697B22
MEQLQSELTAMERRRLKYLAAAFLLVITLSIALALYLASTVGAMLVLGVGYIVWKVFIMVIERQLAMACSVCGRRGLTETPGLPCQLPEYQCRACGMRFRGGRPIPATQTGESGSAD